jgi:DNA-directed RNA polymerase subunit beta
VPESFKVLLKELQALTLDVRVLLGDSTEVEIKESVDDIDDLNVNIEGTEPDDKDRGFIRQNAGHTHIPKKSRLDFIDDDPFNGEDSLYEEGGAADEEDSEDSEDSIEAISDDEPSLEEDFDFDDDILGEDAIKNESDILVDD